MGDKMISNLEIELQNSIEEYQKNPNENTKEKIKNKIITLDKEKTKNYLEELKKLQKNYSNILQEQDRLQKIVKLLTERKKERESLQNIIKKISLDIPLDNIPNIDKLLIFSNKLKVIEIINSISNKLNEKNIGKALEILDKKEFRIVLLEFSLIREDSREEVERYLNSLLKQNNLKILEYYNKSKNEFPNLNIPNMGLEKYKEEIQLDSKAFFIN